MGASASKLSLKNGVTKLSTQAKIPPEDEFWKGFWEFPESIDDVCTFFSSSTIRHVRSLAPENIETLIQVVFTRLCDLRDHPQFPSENALAREALNCIRILGRILPYIYEHEGFAEWEDYTFWELSWKRPIPILSSPPGVIFDHHSEHERQGSQEEGKPLGEKLIDLLVDLLFCPGFTVSEDASYHDRFNIVYPIWQTGVGRSTPTHSSPELESNRIEVLRLLLVLLGKSLYLPQNVLPSTGIKAATYLTAHTPKSVVLPLLCSLLNTALQSSSELWRTTYEIIRKNNTQTLATYSVELLAFLLVYTVPATTDTSPTRNQFRYFLGRIHRQSDLQFLFEGMSKSINQPLHSLISFLPGGVQRSIWAPNIITLFWETIQCNKKFRAFIHESERCLDFMISLLFYSVESKNHSSAQGFLRLCIYVLQTMSVNPGFGARLNTTVRSQESIPSALWIHGFQGTYGDFLIMILYSFLSSKQENLTGIRMPLLCILYNVSPFLRGIGKVPSSRLCALFSQMFSPSFLLSGESNHTLLHCLLESFSLILENNYKANPYFSLAVLQKRFEFTRLRSLSLHGGLDQLLDDQGLRSPSIRSELQYEISRKPSAPVPANRSSSSSQHASDGDPFEIGEDDEEEEDGDGQAGGQGKQDSLLHSEYEEETGALNAPASVKTTGTTDPKGLSEKAKGKLPMDWKESENAVSLTVSCPTLFTQQGRGFVATEEWLQSWLPRLPLHTILLLIDEANPRISDTSANSVDEISRLELRGLVSSNFTPIPFEWTLVSFGWYESLLWGYVFSFELSVSRGTSCVWAGTGIRLFKVQEAAAESPSLMAPRGAVDAVGSNLVSMLNSVNLRPSNLVSEPNQQSTGGSRRSGARGDSVVIREL